MFWRVAGHRDREFPWVFGFGVCAFDYAFRYLVSFQFERRALVTEGETFPNIFSEEGNNAAEPFILRRMRQFMQKQRPILQSIVSDEDPIIERKALRRAGHKVDCTARRLKCWMRWHRNGLDMQDANPFRVRHTRSFCVGHLLSGKRHAVAQNYRLLLAGPVCCQREQAFQLFGRKLSMHPYSLSKKSANKGFRSVGRLPKTRAATGRLYLIY